MTAVEKTISPVNVSRYYYYRLTEEQKGLYGTISKGLKAFQTDIKLPTRPVNEISMIIESVLLDNPLIFHTSSQRFVSDLFKKKTTILPDYKYDKSFVRQQTDCIKKYLRAFDSMKLKSDLEKEKYVYDYCLDHFSYDYAFGEYSFSVLGPILNKTAVCEGISKFVKLALGYIGVDCTVVAGKAKNPTNPSNSDEGHMWNIVTIDGKKYHLDVTFDLTVRGNVKRYDYFNLSDAEINKDHIITTTVPACVISRNDYYTVNSCVVNNPVALEKYIADKLRIGERNIRVKLLKVPKNANIIDKVSSIATQQYVKIFNRNVEVKFSYNPQQMVFEIDFK